MAVRPIAAAGLAAMVLSLGACQDSGMVGGVSTRSLSPVPAQTLSLMQTKGMSQTDPIVIRAFKKEAEMEVWKRTNTGHYALLKTFPICRWSGQLGPKTKQGDRQAPEGFYTITPGQLNPNSAYYLSFDVGYPNAVDRAKGGTGNHIMVHGTCSSSGCFAMTDASMAEVYALTRDALSGGQRGVQFQSYPFRMTAQNVAKFRNDPNAPFWKNLKEGSDYFETLREEPRVAACGTRYAFGGTDVAAGSCTPRIEPLVAEKRDRDNQMVADLVAKGERATRTVYVDGGQNPVFSPQSRASAFASLHSDTEKEQPYSARDYARHNLGDVSRPESLAAGPQEIEIDAKGRPILVAAAPVDAPGPTKAAAAALGKKGDKPKTQPVTLMARQEPAQKDPATTGRINVADADGDISAYQKLLGSILNKENSDKPSAAPESAAASATTAAASAEAAQGTVAPSTQLAANLAKRTAPAAKVVATATAAPKRTDATSAAAGGLRGGN